MRRQKGRLLPKQAKFAAKFAITGDREYAARFAGYHAPAKGASQNLQNPDVLNAIRREQETLLIGDLLPRCIGMASRMIDDPNTPSTAKVKIFSECLAYGFGKKAPALEKDPESMSLAELQAHKAELQRMLDEARRPVLELEARPDDDLFG
jgi:hypothetical protein